MTSNLPTLPDGWEWKKLDELGKISTGKTPPKSNKEFYIDGSIQFVKPPNLQNKNSIFKTDSDEFITLEGAKKSTLLPINTLMVCCIGSLGKFALADKEVITNQQINSIVFDANIINYKYGFYYAFMLEKILNELANEAVVKIVNKTIFSNIQIPLPPLEEQKRLVSLLDTLFAKIDRSIELLDENIAAADALLPSALNTVFGELENEPKKYLKDITSKIGSGATPSGGEKAYKKSGISLIRSMNVHDYGFRDKNLAFIDDQQVQKLNNVVVEENDVLLNITGASVARCCIVDSQYLPARVNQHVAIIRLKNQALPQFVHYYLISPNTKNNLLFNAGGGATREAITKKMIEEFEIPLPPLDIQTQSVAYLDSVRDKVEILKQVQNDKIKNLKALKASILDRAFKGEL